MLQNILSSFEGTCGVLRGISPAFVLGFTVEGLGEIDRCSTAVANVLRAPAGALDGLVRWTVTS